jgi:exosome complex component RRP45
MPRDVEPSLNEKQFFAKALQENIRIDGRAFDQFRELDLEFGDEYGVADVRLGKTRYESQFSVGILSSSLELSLAARYERVRE